MDATTRSRWTRGFALGVAALGLLAFVWLSLRVYRVSAAPESVELDVPPAAWGVGPRPLRLTELAQQHVDRSLVRLEDRSLTAAGRIAAYREELVRAEALLAASLARQPAQARALALLAAIRWELDQPDAERARRRAADAIELAATMAPTDPRVQLQLGELLLKMGRPDEAGPYLRRAAALEPELGGEIVDRMRRNLLDVAEILDTLPPEPAVLAALHRPAVAEGLEQRFLAAAEDRLVADRPASPALLGAYGNVRLELDDAGGLRALLDRIGPQDSAESEAERLRQRSRARLALGSSVEAVEDARAALRLRTTPPFAEHLGDVLLHGGAAVEAIDAYRRALTIVAAGTANLQTRARLNRKIGQSEERRGEVGRAYDAYVRALELDDSEAVSRRRIDEMEAAAGM